MHPGYGFLSENCRVRGCLPEAAGLVFVGPTEHAMMTAMG